MKPSCNEFCEGHLNCPTCKTETCGKEVVWLHDTSGCVFPAAVLCLSCKQTFNIGEIKGHEFES